MEIQYDQCALFQHMNESEVSRCLSCSGAGIQYYEKVDFIYDVLEKPAMLYVLIDGAAFVGRNHYSGRRSVLYEVHPYDIFGISDLFSEQETYDSYAVAVEKSVVLAIPKRFLYHPCGRACSHHVQFIYNILSILSSKNHSLTRKISLLSSGNLRRRICGYLLDNCDKGGVVRLAMNREQLADYLNAERPSLSRELMRMQKEGLIETDRKLVIIRDLEKMNHIVDD